VSDGQMMALWIMLLIGIPGVLVAMDSSITKRIRIAGAVWVVVWWLPPLVLLWIKGVFG
jgi:hypothetical protein